MSPRRAKVLGGETSPGALRRHLIGVTQQLLAAHGATALTTRQIAREAQVADGVLYNHFAGKDDLVLTAMAERADELVAGFLAVVPEPGTGTLEANLGTLAHAAFDLQAGLLPLVAGLLGQPDLLHGFFAAIHAESGPQTAFIAIVVYVQGEQALGRATDDVDAVAVAELMFGACQLRVLMTLMRPTEPSMGAMPTHRGRAEPAEEDLGDVVAGLVRMTGADRVT